MRRRRRGLLMGDPTCEIVSIGVSGARIVGATRERIDYIDAAGEKRFIDLEECVRSWGRGRAQSSGFLPLPGSTAQSTAAWHTRCVGQRGALDNPPWAQFMNERRTRFEFTSYEALYKELLDPLKRAGWHTFDTD
jgi:hypothetical protein